MPRVRDQGSITMKNSTPPIFAAAADYTTVSIEFLERISLGENAVEPFLHQLHECLLTRHPHAEVAVLATCNRLEVYWTEGSVEEMYRGMDGDAAGDCSGDEHSAVFRDLSVRTGVSRDEIAASMKVLAGGRAIEHLFRVASGVESMVIGEHQILGQVEAAWKAATDAGTAGGVLGAVFAAAVRCGRRARIETPIGRNPRDVSTVAVQLAESVVGELAGRRVLVAGVGEMGRLTVKALHHRGVAGVDIVNRGLVRAREAAERWGATANTMERLPVLLEEADIMIASTASTTTILDRRAVESIMERRSFRPLVLIDLALPRDVAPDAASVPGVHLYDLDALKEIAEEGERERRTAIPAVEAIVDDEIRGLRADLGDRAVRPVLSELWNRADELRRETLQSAEKEMGELNEKQRVGLDRMSRLLTNKLLHAPSARLRSEATNGRAVEYADILAELFGLRTRSPEEQRDEQGDG